MNTNTKILSKFRWMGASVLALALVGTGGLYAQDEKHDPTDTTHTWRDHVDENDIMYRGTVMTVKDGKFTLRTPTEGTMEFTIPNDADYGASVYSGNDVQVWVDGGTVSYVATYGEVIADDQSSTVNDKSTMDDKAMKTDAMDKDNLDVDVDADKNDDTYTARADVEADLDADRENEIDTRVSSTVDVDDDYDSDDSWDSETLPSTASSLPLVAGFGLLFVLAGVALRKLS